MTAAAIAPWLRFSAVVLVTAALWLGQTVLVPLALAILLTFLLTPIVVVLQRHLGRSAAVVLVVVLTFSLLGGIAWGVSEQLRGLAHELPQYRRNIRQRIADIRNASRGGAVEKVQEAVSDIQDAIDAEGARRPGARGSPPAPAPTNKATELWSFPTALGPLLDALATAGLVVLLAIFMLLERQELRNRLIRLVGYRRVGRTTQALDEAAARISRYLLMQFLINGIYGLGVGVGLYLLGVPHALLWAFLGAMLRFVPYIGPWIAALAPIALTLAVFAGWKQPLLVASLFVVLELFTNLVLETFLYAGAAGVSTVGLLVAIAYWTWIWGPAGLLMATPLTVCLIVLSRRVPGMQFLVTLLGDEPALTPDIAYYQRLLAGDVDEATEIVEARLTGPDPEAGFDALMLPALTYARRDRAELSRQQRDAVLRGTVAILDDVVTGAPGSRVDAAVAPTNGIPQAILALPAVDEVDEVALRMLRAVLDATRFSLEAASTRMLSSEVVALVRDRGYRVVCVAALPPGGLSHAKYLCKKLSGALPDLKILVGRWGPPGIGGEGADTLRTAGAAAVATALTETRDQLYQLAPPLARLDADARAGRAGG